MFIGRLARDLKARERGIGEILLVDAFRRAQRINEGDAAIALIVLDSKDERSAKFYDRFGFLPSTNNPRRLFVPLATVVKGYLASKNPQFKNQSPGGTKPRAT